MPQCDNRFSRLCDRPPFILNSVIVWARRTRPAPRRVSSESRRGSRMRLKALPAGLWPALAPARLRVQSNPALARATAPGAGWDISS